jgi:hypothetical protein
MNIHAVLPWGLSMILQSGEQREMNHDNHDHPHHRVVVVGSNDCFNTQKDAVFSSFDALFYRVKRFRRMLLSYALAVVYPILTMVLEWMDPGTTRGG